MKLEDITKFDVFSFNDYVIEYEKDKVTISYNYEIEKLVAFNHVIEIPCTNNNINKDYVDKLAFNLGIVEIVNYWKSTMAKNVIIKCGKLNEEQVTFFKKLFYNGLGEFLYRNNISVSLDSFMNFTFEGEEKTATAEFNGLGNMIAIGGGKDSCVSLELLKNEEHNSCVIMNPKSVNIECCHIAGYQDSNIIVIKRKLDSKIIDLNNKGFLNGHVPFSGVVAFVCYLTAYLNNKKNIILSNESSANEVNVKGTNVNHQYSKSYEFEKDFQDYSSKYLGKDIWYFSLLRGLSEYQIGLLFAKKCKKYYSTFKSCNVGSKTEPWHWCGKCAKCLFVYSLLSPSLYPDELINIFGHDLFEDESLLTTFEELLGKKNIKPFDCVGTFEEVNYAITKTIKNHSGNLPYLLEYYKDNYYDESILDLSLENYYNEENSIDEYFTKIVRSSMFDER
jgi:hypothetical protein